MKLMSILYIDPFSYGYLQVLSVDIDICHVQILSLVILEIESLYIAISKYDLIVIFFNYDVTCK
jgi:hypothetical protein